MKGLPILLLLPSSFIVTHHKLTLFLTSINLALLTSVKAHFSSSLQSISCSLTSVNQVLHSSSEAMSNQNFIVVLATATPASAAIVPATGPEKSSASASKIAPTSGPQKVPATPRSRL
ncbi:hypothetical protein TWF132_006018 [Orbilia oligospora]|nr:hypothetical protein TWF132_006018 [Orbilia oligospora]